LKTFFLIVATCLCRLVVYGQQPVDSLHVAPPNTISSDTIEIVSSDIIFISDTTDWSLILPSENLEYYYRHSPAKAAMLSAVLPGLGQVYNGKYWKIPIVYAAIGISVERFITFQNLYNRYRRAYITINDGDPYTNFHDELFPEFFTETQKTQYINRFKDRFRTYRDWSIVAIVAAYALNIIDANVDAHLMDFSLDDNISLRISPSFFDNVFESQKIGLSLRVFF